MVSIILRPDPRRSGYFILREMRPKSVEPVRLRFRLRSHVWRPPTDVYETEEAVVVRVEIAGMDEDDFSVILDGRYLSVRGVRADPPERRAYHQMEIRFGEFSTDVELPYEVILEEIEAYYSNGFLRITLPKAQPKKIHVD